MFSQRWSTDFAWSVSYTTHRAHAQYHSARTALDQSALRHIHGACSVALRFTAHACSVRAQVHTLLDQSAVGHTRRMLALRYKRRMIIALRYTLRLNNQRSGILGACLIALRYTPRMLSKRTGTHTVLN
jgi:hypothetical protein